MSQKKWIAFKEALAGRAKGIREMAKTDIMGARREVDQLRREMVHTLAHVDGYNIFDVVPAAKILDRLDKIDLIPVKKGDSKKFKIGIGWDAVGKSVVLWRNENKQAAKILRTFRTSSGVPQIEYWLMTGPDKGEQIIGKFEYDQRIKIYERMADAIAEVNKGDVIYKASKAKVKK